MPLAVFALQHKQALEEVLYNFSFQYDLYEARSHASRRGEIHQNWSYSLYNKFCCKSPFVVDKLWVEKTRDGLFAHSLSTPVMRRNLKSDSKIF
jgi:hypothetical protein